MDTATAVKRTPGPWEFDGVGIYEQAQKDTGVVLGEDGTEQTYRKGLIALVYEPFGALPARPNARLITAAPDLAAALRDLLPLCGYAHMDDSDLRYEQAQGNGVAPLILAARSALAKAEGGQS